jgi:hypothetical protein
MGGSLNSWFLKAAPKYFPFTLKLKTPSSLCYLHHIQEYTDHFTVSEPHPVFGTTVMAPIPKFTNSVVSKSFQAITKGLIFLNYIIFY